MKERLTGAIILVVLIVLLVPELLSGPSRSVSPAPAAVTSSEDPPLRSYTINLADDAHSTGAAGTSATPAQANGPAQPTPITESPSQTQPAQTQPEDSDAAWTTDRAQAVTPSEAPSAATSAANEAAALPTPKDPQQTLAPPPQHSSPTSSPPQKQVVPEKPTPAPPRYASADRHSATDHAATAERSELSGGWVVQLGVFSVQANAERLAQELKSQGFHAQVSQMSGSRPMWRVRTGPVAEHAAAEQLSARLRAAGHPGSIVPK